MSIQTSNDATRAHGAAQPPSGEGAAPRLADDGSGVLSDSLISWDEGGKLCFGTGADAGTIDSKGNIECRVGTVRGT